MQLLKYKGRQPFFYIDLPRLSEPYLFKESNGYRAYVQAQDVPWLMISYRDLFEIVEGVPDHGKKTEREEKEAAVCWTEEEEIKRPIIALRDMLVKVGRRAAR